MRPLDRSSPHVHISGSVDEAWQTGLGRIAGGREVEWSRAWLRAEERRISDEYYYLDALDSDGTPLASAVCLRQYSASGHTLYNVHEVLLGSEAGQLAEATADEDGGQSRARLTELRASVPVGVADALVCVVPAAAMPGVIWDLDQPAARRDGALDALLAAMEGLAHDLGIDTVIVTKVRGDDRFGILDNCLGVRGYGRALISPDVVLDVSYDSLDEYFTSFSSSRRKFMRKERSAFLESGAQVISSGPDGLTENLARLQEAQYRRYGHQTSRAAVLDRFDRARTIPGLTVMRVVDNGGDLGFIAFLHQAAPEGRIVGRLYGFAANSIGAYFNLAYYELINYAIRAGVEVIDYGVGTYEAKLARGCRLVSLYMYVKCLRGDPPGLPDTLQLRSALERSRCMRLLRTRRDLARQSTMPRIE